MKIDMVISRVRREAFSNASVAAEKTVDLSFVANSFTIAGKVPGVARRRYFSDHIAKTVNSGEDSNANNTLLARLSCVC